MSASAFLQVTSLFLLIGVILMFKAMGKFVSETIFYQTIRNKWFNLSLFSTGNQICDAPRHVMLPIMCTQNN